MEGLQLPSAKILYIVSELRKQGTIDDNEKAQIKEKIVSDDPKVLELLQRYEQSGDESVLRNGIIDILRPQVSLPVDNQDFGIVVSKRNNEGAPQDEVSSPLGNQLFERKKKHQNTNELQGLIKGIKPIN